MFRQPRRYKLPGVRPVCVPKQYMIRKVCKRGALSRGVEGMLVGYLLEVLKRVQKVKEGDLVGDVACG